VVTKEIPMGLRRAKISIIGAGNVGATAAHWAAAKELGDIVLVDIVEGMPQGKGLDLRQAGPVEGFDSNIIGTNGYDETAGSDVVVITSGIARKPGMSRDDLLNTNTKIVAEVSRAVVAKSPDAILVIVSNPLDAMCHVAKQASGLPANRVVGMAGVLDSARFRTFLALELNVSVEDVHAFVLGGHGDTMVPLTRYSSVAGIPIEKMIPKDRLDSIVQRTRDGGAEIVKLLKTGSAYYAPAASSIEMVASIVRDKRRVLPCACYLEGQYGTSGYYLGVPAIIGKNGVEKVIEVELLPDEKAMLDKSLGAVKELVAALKI
jgi:malate dehydrogenase